MQSKPQFNYVILPDKKLIIELYYGTFTQQDILLFKKRQANYPLWDSSFSKLSDMRYSTLQITEAEIEKLTTFVVANKHWNVDRKTASVTNKPNHIVFEKLYNIYKPNESKISFEAFSSIESAAFWLDINQANIPFIKNKLADLQEQLSK